MNPLQVTEMIERAFAKVARSPDESLHLAELGAQAVARKISGQEWAACRQLDTDTSWHEVPDEDLLDCNSALFHLTPVGWRYYVPAYMRLALKFINEPVWRDDVPHRVIFALTYRDDYPGMSQYKLSRYEMLDLRQSEAVRAFLECVKCYGGSGVNFYAEHAEEALSRYWALPAEQRPRLSWPAPATAGG